MVWIDGGIHANEVLGAQQLIENIYELVSRTDAETTRFLNDVIVLDCLVNPDGMELVSNWYMRQPRSPTTLTEWRSAAVSTNMQDTTIIAISTCPRLRKPTRSIAFCFVNGFPRSFMTIIKRARQAQ